jgi:hypothetical protein
MNCVEKCAGFMHLYLFLSIMNNCTHLSIRKISYILWELQAQLFASFFVSYIIVSHFCDSGNSSCVEIIKMLWLVIP